MEYHTPRAGNPRENSQKKVNIWVLLQGQEMILAHVGDSRAVLCQQGRAVRDLAALTVTNGPQVVKGQPSTWPQQMAQVRLTEDHKPGAPGVPTSFEGGEGWWTQASKFATALLGFNLWEWRVIFCPAQKPEPWKLLLGCKAGLMDNRQCAFVCAKTIQVLSCGVSHRMWARDPNHANGKSDVLLPYLP